MDVWAIANQKGGVGKTTTAILLARGLAGHGGRVLLVDLDPHASLTRAFRIPAVPPPRGAHELFDAARGDAGALARATAIDRVRLLPAQPALATIERRGATQPGIGLALGRALHGLRAGYDHAVLDCPPTVGLLLVNALAAADRLLIPTQTDPLALHGLADMLRTADMVERSRRRALPRHVVPTLFDRRTRTAVQCLETLHGEFAAICWPRVVPMDTRLRDACALTLPEAPGGRGARAYAGLLEWLRGLEAPRQVAA